MLRRLSGLFGVDTLWGIFQWCSPAGAAAMMGWWAHLSSQPPVIIAAMALIGAATTICIAGELKKNSIFGMLTIASIHPIQFLRQENGLWPAPGSEDTELGVFMGPEVRHGEAEVHARVQA